MNREAARAIRQIERVRSLRARPGFDPAIAPAVEAEAAAARQAQRALGGFAEAWEAVIPAELALHTSIVSVRGGTASVHVDSAPVRYELDRFLRGGGEAALRARYTRTLLRVRLTIGSLDRGSIA